MPLHIGIVACLAEGAARCYRTICTQGARYLGEPHAHPEVSMHTQSFDDYVERLNRAALQRACTDTAARRAPRVSAE